MVGPAQRLFAAHEDVLSKSPYFAQACRAQFFEAANKRIELANEDPEVFSAVLEYLYKGDYTPHLAHDKKRQSFYLSKTEGQTPDATVQYNGTSVLKDTVIYVCVRALSNLPHSTNDRATVCRPSLRSPSPASSCTQEARPSVRYPRQHHSVFRSLRILSHAGFRFQSTCTLPRTHHPQPRDFQAQRHHANRDDGWWVCAMV